MQNADNNFANVIKAIVQKDVINSTFEARQNYYKLFQEKESEVPVFLKLSQTGINLEMPKRFAFGLEHFIEHMKESGWRFIKQNSVDFEFSDTYSVVQPVKTENGHRQWDIDLSKYQSEINMPYLLEKMYYDAGFITNEGEPVSLHEGCKCAESCWAGIDERRPGNENMKWSYLSFPWIGQSYYKNKVAILGINTNEGGGFDFNTQIIAEARKELKAGKTRVNFGYVFPDGTKYVGTFLWHRIVCYTKAIHAALGCNEDNINEVMKKEDEFRKLENIDAEYDRNAFLNHIKCSPLGERSKPSAAMWENCGAHILRNELDILSPNYLVVLGVGDNIYYLKNSVFNGDYEEISTTLDVKIYLTRHLGKPLKIIALPHPSSSIKESLISDVFNATLKVKHLR